MVINSKIYVFFLIYAWRFEETLNWQELTLWIDSIMCLKYLGPKNISVYLDSGSFCAKLVRDKDKFFWSKFDREIL